MLNSNSFQLFHLDKLVLSLSQKLGALLEVLLKGGVFELEFIHILFHRLELDLSHVSIAISFEDINLTLQLVVLTVQEVHLV